MEKISEQEVRRHKGFSFVGVATCFQLYDGSGEFFMAKRSQNARDEQGTWENGGGGLKLNNTAEENVRREVQEEYSVIPDKVDFWGYRDVFRQKPDGTETHWLALDFGVLVDRSKVKINEPDMFDDSGWFTLSNLPSPLHSQIARMHKKYRKQYEEILRPKSSSEKHS